MQSERLLNTARLLYLGFSYFPSTFFTRNLSNYLRNTYQMSAGEETSGVLPKGAFFLNTATKWQHFRLRRFTQKTSGVNGEMSYGARGDGSSRREISVHSPVTPRPPHRFDLPVTRPRSRLDHALICP